MAEASENPRAVVGDNKASFRDFYRDQNTLLPAALNEEHADLVAQAADLKAAYQDAPNVVDNDDREKTMTELGARLSKFLKLAEAQRVTDKAPTLQSTRIVDNWFADLTAVVQPCFKQVERLVNAYKDEKKAIARRIKEEEERKAREARDAADRAAAEARRVASEAASAEEREKAAQTAINTAAIAIAAEKSISKAPLSSVARGVDGTSSQQSARWTGDVTELDILDLNALRPYLSIDELNRAVRQFAQKYKDTRPLEGARIYEKSSTSFRA